MSIYSQTPAAAPGAIRPQDWTDTVSQVVGAVLPIAISMLSTGPNAAQPGAQQAAPWGLTGPIRNSYTPASAPQGAPIPGGAGGFAPQAVPWGSIIEAVPGIINAVGGLFSQSANPSAAFVPQPRLAPEGVDLNQLISTITSTVLSTLAANPAFAAARPTA